MADAAMDQLVRGVRFERERVPSFERYPFSIPAIRAIDELAFDRKVTFLVGDNGSGKSTLIEAIAVAAGFNAEGGGRNFAFQTRSSESELHHYFRLIRGARRIRDGYFLRAESLFNVATNLEEIARGPMTSLAETMRPYGGTSLHEQSHGESFLALLVNRLGDNAFYLLDEPESALSPKRLLSLLSIMHRLVARGTQFVIATHSPILMAFPGALIYQLDANGISETAYEDTDHFLITRDFLNHRERYLKHLFADGED